MGLFNRKKQATPRIVYDEENMQAILKCNTCNSERVMGFKDIRTGKFTEVANIRSDGELKSFMELYGITQINEVYGW